ncbi:MAG: glycosyltransferase family 4 protein [Desulfopila sp.]
MTSTDKPVIAYVLKGYPRISETFISNEILMLEQLGFVIRLFSMRQPRENFSHASVQRIRARVDYLPSELLLDLGRLLGPNIFLASTHPRRYRQAIGLAGARFRRSRSIATIKHLLQAGYMTHNFLAREPEIHHLHGHFAHSPTSVTMFAALLSARPFSFTAHAKDIYTSDPEQLREKIDRARFVVTCTRHNSRYLHQIAPETTTPIHCIYHGIDLTLFHHQADRAAPTAPYRLFTVARLTEKKGLPTIYRALALLRDRGLAFRHTLIGDGDDREKIRQLIADLHLTRHCQLLGTRTHDQVLAQFRASDVFVLGCEIAQNGDRDGIPNVLVESLAMGVPAVSTTVSAIPEILLDGQTGLTVPPSDPKAMASAIQTLLGDQKLRHRLASEGRKWVTANFDNRHWTRQLADIFQGQLHGPRPLSC